MSGNNDKLPLAMLVPAAATVFLSVAIPMFRFVIVPQWIESRFTQYKNINLANFEDHTEKDKEKPFFRATLNDRVSAFRKFPSNVFVWKERMMGIFPSVTSIEPRHLIQISRMDKSARFSLIGHFLGKESVLFQNDVRGKRDRLLLNVAFDTESLQHHFCPMMVDAANQLRVRLEASEKNNDGFSPSKQFGKTTLEVIARGGFSCEMGGDSPIANDFSRLLELGMNPILLLPFGVQLMKFYYRALLARVDGMINQIISHRRGDNEDSNSIHDLLQIMMEIPNQSIPDVDKETWMRDNLKLFMFAGTDTTACCLQFTSILLALNPQYQQRIREEIAQVCGDSNNGEITFAQAAKLKFVEACIKESLRLYPPAVGIARTCEPTFNGLEIPPHTVLRLDVLLMQRRQDLFSRPDEYLPDRWMPNSKETAREDAWAPFSAGIRSCIGKHFAMMEMKIILAVLLRDKKFETNETNMPNASASRGILTPIGDYVLKYVNV